MVRFIDAGQLIQVSKITVVHVWDNEVEGCLANLQRLRAVARRAPQACFVACALPTSQESMRFSEIAEAYVDDVTHVMALCRENMQKLFCFSTVPHFIVIYNKRVLYTGGDMNKVKSILSQSPRRFQT